MKFKHSIQKRVVLMFGGFTCLLALSYSALSIVAAYIVEDTVLESVLDQEAQYIQRLYRETGDLGPARLDYVQLYENPEQAPVEIAGALRRGNNAGEIYGASDKHYHTQWVHLNGEREALLVADVTSLLAVRNMSREILLLFSLALALAGSCAIWLAYRIARRTTSPIVKLAQSVIRQYEGSHSSVHAAKNTDNEVTFLAKTVDGALRQLQDLLNRESAFNRDLSHEMRTPLTVISNTLSLAESRPLTATDVRQLKDATLNMQQVVESLLALARAESDTSEVIAMRELLEECIIELYPKFTEAGFNIELRGRDIKVVGNARLVTLIINNLIHNALAHASQQSLVIEIFKNRIVFTNPAAPMALPDPTQPGLRRSQSEGIGQGLFLVSRILETLGWDYQIIAPEQHFQFTIKPLLVE